MNFLQGSKKEFFEFIDLITEKDRVGILTHNDLDGIASAIFLEEILKSKKRKVDFIDFIGYNVGMFKLMKKEIMKKGLTKIFFTDINVGADPVGFVDLSKEVDCYLIDHHPADYIGDNILKTESADCSALTIYNLGEGVLDYRKWEWLVSATIVSEFSYNKEENFEFLRNFYGEIKKENIITSIPGEIAKIIGAALVYYNTDLKKVYDLVKVKNLEELEEAKEKINEEIEKGIEKFKESAEFFSEKNIYIFAHDSEYKIASTLTTILSLECPEKTYICISDKQDGFVQVNVRNQSGQTDVNLLMKKGIGGLENSTAGGHAKASGGTFLKKDLNKFKENLLR